MNRVGEDVDGAIRKESEERGHKTLNWGSLTYRTLEIMNENGSYNRFSCTMMVKKVGHRLRDLCPEDGGSQDAGS